MKKTTTTTTTTKKQRQRRRRQQQNGTEESSKNKKILNFCYISPHLDTTNKINHKRLKRPRYRTPDSSSTFKNR